MDWFKKQDKEAEKDSLRKLFFMFLMLLFIFSSSDVFADFHVECPECNTQIKIEIERIQGGRFFPDTWICPKKSCGFSNYDGIEYCGLCGTKRIR